jgi:hypothetical protein
MAFSTRSLTRITHQVAVGLASGAVAPRQISVFSYATDDAAAVVEAAGYFNDARSRLTVGSIIFASMVLGGTPVLKSLIVTAVPATGNVTVALQTTTAG